MSGIKELAKYLNISIGTISRALNDKPDVNAETRKRVMEAAEQLSYFPNQSGRSLRQGMTNIVGLTCYASPIATRNTDNFVFGLMVGMQTVLGPKGLDLVVLPSHFKNSNADYLQRVVTRRIVDAVIITGTEEHDKRISLLNTLNIPFASLGRSNVLEDFAWIDLDFQSVARQSVERLVSKGHRRIAICLPDHSAIYGNAYFNEYMACLARFGIPFDPEIVYRVPQNEFGGYDAAEKILELENRPTAVMLIYEFLAIGLYRKFAEKGLTVGKDIAVIGFRDHPIASILSPRLTAFSVDFEQVGQSLARLLLSRMPQFARDHQNFSLNVLWPMTLVPGESDAGSITTG